MKIISSQIFRLTFLVLVAVATLFPPFNWGEEILGTELERLRMKANDPELYNRLPIKSYSFLFEDAKQEFLVKWGWDSDIYLSVPVYEILQRHLNIGELILEYILALIIALVGAIIGKRLINRNRNVAA